VWTVTVAVAPNTAKEITAFSFATPPATGTINADKTIVVTVPYGTDVTRLAPAIEFEGAAIAPPSGAARNFTAPVTYLVTADDGSTAVWTVTVAVALNTAKEITAFGFTTPPATGTINADKTIVVTVPYGTDRTNLVPTITHLGVSVSPESGAARDFTNPVTYTVTAENGTVQAYEVTVTVQEQNTVRLAGTVTVVKPAGLLLTGITVTAYKEAGRTTVIGATTLSAGETWDMEFPVASLADSRTAWFKVSATDETNSYTVDAGDSGIIPESGITDLALSLTIYRVTIDPAIVGGSVAVDKSYETAGDAIDLTVTPDPNYRLKSGTLKHSYGGVEYPITGSGPDYAFTMPAADVTISAFFNKVLGFTIEGPSEKAIGVTMEHSDEHATSATEISWSGDEHVTLTLESSDYTAEDGNLRWIVSGIEITAADGNFLVIKARDYVQRSYTVTVMIAEDGQWYSTEIAFEVTE
jgi:hypothetical protein